MISPLNGPSPSPYCHNSSWVRASKAPTAVLEIGNRKQLFIDDYMIQSLTDARQVLNTATKAPNNPVIEPDRPWAGSLSVVDKVM